MKLLIISLLIQYLQLIQGQRVAPGVPPQQYHYEQQPVHQGHQQVQYQQQQYHQPPQQQVQYQQPQHHQQPPPQQHQQPPPQHHQQAPPQQHHQQAPPQQHHQQQQQPHGHGHGHPPHGNPQVLNVGNLQHEKDHIAEHMEVPIDTSKMSEQELQFHYFKMHDADNNNKLDGCELIKSLIHWHEHPQNAEGDDPTAEKREAQPQDDETLQPLIDPILEIMDKNYDGYITYAEYRAAELADKDEQH
uniref:Putative mediator of rna polymerase ii transcription subunit 12-like protein n=1 Tax=Corethrella appendiculata TaxID=1370023 RepID=U5EDJ3_9DIPT